MNTLITTPCETEIPSQDHCTIAIETNNSSLKLHVSEDRQLLQKSFGSKLSPDQSTYVAYPCAGDGWIDEPALRVTHADGNTSTDLRVVGHSTVGDLTKIELKDPEYPLFVDLFYRTYPHQD